MLENKNLESIQRNEFDINIKIYFINDALLHRTTTTHYSITLLHRTAGHGNFEIVKKLIEKGVEVNMIDIGVRIALDVA
jgi:ankyrin repeat protein